MLIVNIFDDIFPPDSSAGYKPRHFEYVWYQPYFPGTTIFTDRYILNNTVDQVKSKIKLGWLVESREVIPYDPQFILSVANKYDCIFTHDKFLLDFNPSKFKFCIPGSQRSQISYDEIRIYHKTKMVSMSVSYKTIATGHRFRHEVVKNLGNKIDIMGSGYKPYARAIEPYRDYRFVVMVENAFYDYYFTEKILEPLWAGTIPIYKGPACIKNYFDMNGILTFNTIEELDKILSQLSPSLYESKLQYVKNNFYLSQKGLLRDGAEDYLFEHYGYLFEP